MGLFDAIRDKAAELLGGAEEKVSELTSTAPPTPPPVPPRTSPAPCRRCPTRTRSTPATSRGRHQEPGGSMSIRRVLGIMADRNISSARGDVLGGAGMSVS